MKRRMILATGNEGKIKEIRSMFEDLKLEILSMKEAGADLDIEEDGSTFKDNAEIKAKAVWDVTGDLVLADDSGLIIDYLNGEPGIYSARYLGEDTPYEEKNQIIIDRMDGTCGAERSARFVSAIAVVLPDGRVLHTEHALEGQIAHSPKGKGGFGYDPIFYLPDYNKTTAEIPLEKKNEISHRGKALQAMKGLLRELLAEEYQ